MPWFPRAKPMVSAGADKLSHDAILHFGKTITKTDHQISAALTLAEVQAYATALGGPIFARPRVSNRRT